MKRRLKSTSGQEKPKGRKCEFSANKRHLFSVHTISKNSNTGLWSLSPLHYKHSLRLSCALFHSPLTINSCKCRRKGWGALGVLFRIAVREGKTSPAQVFGQRSPMMEAVQCTVPWTSLTTGVCTALPSRPMSHVKVLIKHLAIFFLFPSKKFLSISFKIQLLETSPQKQNEQRQKQQDVSFF
jgi:hypothetical protein